jgi:hypothetical protein
MPKITVITNAAGDIIGTASLTGDKGAPTVASVHGGPQTRVLELDITEDVLRLPASDRHVALKTTYAAQLRPAK